MNMNFTPSSDEAMQVIYDWLDEHGRANEKALVKKAYDFAAKAHDGQFRRSGEPYISHPIQVATVVAKEFNLGVNSICAALLHDVVEDTDTSIKTIQREFGDDIAFLVKALTKPKTSRAGMTRQVDNFSQMMESFRYDVRVVLIKMADRLHNMRTLGSMPARKQMKIAGETDLFYAPLANRLGLYHTKIELENLSFRFRCPKEYQTLEDDIKKCAATMRPTIDSFIATVRSLLAEKGITSVNIEAYFRKPFSIRRKMAKMKCDFAHLEHPFFVRVVFADDDTNGLSELQQALKIYSILSEHFEEQHGSILNYIAKPKDNGYQSMHVNLMWEGHWIEVHISSQAMRRVSRMGCVAQRTDSTINKWIENFRNVLKDISEHMHNADFIKGVTANFYNDNIDVYTPEGDCVNLPKGGTAIDFAYSLNLLNPRYTNVGPHAQVARINGRLCSIKTTLKRGDRVEIVCNPRIHPQEDWLKYAHSYTSQTRIAEYLESRPEPLLHRCPLCRPIPGEEVIGYNDHGTTQVHKPDCPEMISLAAQDGDNVIEVTFSPDATLYPVTISAVAIDRFHLFSDIMDCISNTLRLSISRFCATTSDEVATVDIDFAVHSYGELQEAVRAIAKIPGVDTVNSATK